MQVRINAVQFTIDVKLEEYIKVRLDKLTTYYDKIQEAEVFLRLENQGAAVKDKVAEIKLIVPGSILFAKETDKNFEKALDDVVEDLRTQLVKYKDKIRAK
jgi:putative sigma-54 modulation protein